MRNYLVIVAVVGACGHPREPKSRAWCDDFVVETSSRTRGLIEALTKDPKNRIYGAEQIRAVTGHGLDLAMKVCADARGDSADDEEARSSRIIRLEADFDEFLNLHTGGLAASDADIKELQRRFDELMQAFVAPPK